VNTRGQAVPLDECFPRLQTAGSVPVAERWQNLPKLFQKHPRARFWRIVTLAGSARFQELQELRATAWWQTPFCVRACLARPRTRAATRSKALRMPGHHLRGNRPASPVPAAFIPDQCSRLAWGRPAFALAARFLLPGALRSRSSGTGCDGRLFSPLTGAVEVGGARSGSSRWGCAKGYHCPARGSRARTRSVKCGGARAPVRSAGLRQNKHARGRLRGYPVCAWRDRWGIGLKGFLQ